VACDLVASRAWPVGTRVTLLGAIEPVVDWTGLAPPRGDQIEAESAALQLVLDEAADGLRRAGLVPDTVVERGIPAELLVSLAAETFADLIVVGSRGMGPAASAIVGSVSAHLVDHAGCPVLVARSGTASRMLVASDGSRSSQSIPRILASWGNAFKGLPTEVLSVSHGATDAPWATATERADRALHEAIADQVADEMMELGWHAAAAVRAGDPSRQIVDEGREWGADLIVTGSRGIGTLRRLMTGSVAHDVLLHARSSVLVMRGHVAARATRPELAGAAPIAT
jgi:nucleotide-binding universal stress UspA family protein